MLRLLLKNKEENKSKKIWISRLLIISEQRTRENSRLNKKHRDLKRRKSVKSKDSGSFKKKQLIGKPK